MELDDLKHAWRNNIEHPQISANDEHLKVQIAEIIRSKRGIASYIRLELVLTAFIYIVVALVVGFYFEYVPMFIIKLIVIIFLGTLPIYYRLYSLMRWLKIIDYGRDIRSNLNEYVHYYKITMRIYGGWVHTYRAALCGVYYRRIFSSTGALGAVICFGLPGNERSFN